MSCHVNAQRGAPKLFYFCFSTAYNESEDAIFVFSFLRFRFSFSFISLSLSLIIARPPTSREAISGVDSHTFCYCWRCWRCLSIRKWFQAHFSLRWRRIGVGTHKVGLNRHEKQTEETEKVPNKARTCDGHSFSTERFNSSISLSVHLLLFRLFRSI